jgi:hypothetical protein
MPFNNYGTKYTGFDVPSCSSTNAKNRVNEGTLSDNFLKQA